MAKKKTRDKPKPSKPHVTWDVLNNSIFLRGKIRTSTLNLIKRALDRILAVDPYLSDWLFFFINSGGGDVDATDEILHLLNEYSPRLITIATKETCSGAILLSQTGSYRFATPHTVFLMHAMIYGRQYVEDQTDRWHEAKLREIHTDNALQLAILTAHGRPYGKIKQMFHEKVTFGSRTAKQLNLINAILPAGSSARLRQNALKHIAQQRRIEKKNHPLLKQGG